MHGLRGKMCELDAAEKEFKMSMDAGDQGASLVDDFLEKARQEAEAGTPSSVRVRTLVRLFGSERRGANVVRRMQQQERLRRGSMMDPDFTSGWIDDTVVLRLAVASAEPPRPDIKLLVGSLASAHGGVTSVKLDGTLEEARALLLRFDFSQSRSSPECGGYEAQ